ncbi:sensor domain-containing diguanylate cyclase [Pseudomonas rubra]|uniref:diguanylate cyclase n=1 Tax=Pseudomonas rubra TaxID=2942627 RepID=A0ABT5PC82_9PSED|nr:GGDEF domain-containing protein [Pseudomonas rubra]MDD1015559.1 GGDEF domain-containing protein [Pseudomonas rubra]MDD1038817.1 GGDEF domain-containing protein [Pseudomonas rubra]MDD1153704.1 GGDEF domain-containing protein [Pseudomonas rubra]
MTDEAQRWKEKYLKSIEQQEKLERRWEARLDLLRRGLVRSTLAAEGSDRAVDQCMKEMREVIRTDNMDAALAGLIPRLEKAVLDSEQRRETRIAQVSTALTSLVTQLQALPLPSEVSRPLKKFAKQVEARASQSREVPLLLGELSGLQGQALSALEQPEEAQRPGLLQRLFGNREAETEALQPALAGPATVPELREKPAQLAQVHAEPVPLETVDVDELQSLPVAQERLIEPLEPAEIEGEAAQPAPTSAPEIRIELPVEPEPEPQQPQPEAAPESPPEDAEQAVLALLEHSPDDPATESSEIAAQDDEEAHYALPDGTEPTYSSVAAHIEDTLLGLLDDLTLPERHKAQAQSMRERLEHGLNWYELLPVLDDLAVLMLAINDSGQHEFEAYLQQLNERLESFQSHLHEASEGHADNTSAARDLDSQLREHVDSLQSSVQGAADLGSLKNILENRLEGLLGTMDEHQQQRDQREQDMANRLQGLAERVASMEQEALGYREHLEEQRQKALIDPLTGLPNRAAWSERVDQEVLEWQENGGHLLMAILDLDHFKRINDGYGHLAGDKVLKIVASVLRKRLRSRDFIARFGGEEFVLLIPQTSLPAGCQLAETLRAAIEACPFHFKGERVTITLSIGISAFRSGERSEAVLKRADEALYRAKHLGRNRVEQG